MKGILLVAVFVFMPAFAFAQDARESAYDRVMRTQTLRCGYGLEEPYTYVDAKTGAVKGIFHDYVEELAKNLSLKVEWTEEMGWGQMPAALEAGRVDAFCTVTWKSAGRARIIDYVTPITYQPALVVARADDQRFDNNPAALNDPKIHITGVEGELELKIAHDNFPNANASGEPQNSDFSVALTDVATKKADAIVVTGVIFTKFDQANPGKLRAIPGVRPLQVSGEAIVVKAGEDKLRRMLDNATIEMLETGAIDRIIAAYKIPPKTFYVAEPSKREPR
jgi:ABC-type amino acid transport substrate-binding protein